MDVETILIKTKRLILREYAQNDRDALLDILKQPGFSYHSLKPDVATIDMFLQHALDRRLEKSPSGKRASFRLAVTLPSGSLIGHCGLAQFDPAPQLIEFGYELFFFIDPRFQRHGYNKEAAQALINFARENYNIDKIFATVAPDNAGSLRTLQGLGFIANNLDCSFLNKDDGKPRLLYTLDQ